MVFVLLTLKRHRDGLWVSRLVEQLEPLLEKESTVEDGGTVDDTASKLKVVALEDWLRGPANIDDLFGDCCAIINRVSDAAEPHLFKATLVWQQVVPAPLIRPSGHLSPPTKLLLEPNVETVRQAHRSIQNDRHGPSASTLPAKCLLKPNSGGFGAGILELGDSIEAVNQDVVKNAIASLSDRAALVQAYVSPKDNKIYRVWFLNGRIQCAVERTVTNDGDGQFSGGCSASGVCSREVAGKKAGADSPTSFKPWSVDQDVKDEILRLLDALEDAHAGSVEFLCDSGGHRLYFDLNLLSTLPILGAVENFGGPWPVDYDPWRELALGVVDVVFPREAVRLS